jgi:hypothetical protein
MIVVLVISIGFLVPKAAHGNLSSSQRSRTHPDLPEYRGGNQTASATTGVHSHDHANKSSPKEILSSFGSPSQLVDAELAQMSPQKSASGKRDFAEVPLGLHVPEARFWIVSGLPTIRQLNRPDLRSASPILQS